MRKKLLYITHVDWDWIKQRPHFLAEELSRHFDVTVVYMYSLRRSRMTRNPREGLKFHRILNLPFQYRLPWLYKMNRALLCSYFRVLTRWLSPDYIWLTHPLLYGYIPKNAKAHIVYDCMDDVQSFGTGCVFYRERLAELETRLLQRADTVFVSSEHLAGVLAERSPSRRKMIVLRNAFGGGILPPAFEHRPVNRKFRLTYTGTVDSWFDFDAIRYCAESIDNIEFEIVGPVVVDVTPWEHERILFRGPVRFTELYDTVKDSDCLVMPFKVDDLVLSVDPVKLYDYVNYGKPIVSVYYDEIRRFAPFVDFYSSRNELLAIIKRMAAEGFKRKYSEEERANFLAGNSWEARARQIPAVLLSSD